MQEPESTMSPSNSRWTGNLYCLGTGEAPVRLTVAEEFRTPDNTFAGLWGGI